MIIIWCKITNFAVKFVKTMGKSNGKRVARYLILGFGLAILLILVAGISSMLESTMINTWLFFGVVAFVAAATGMVLYRPWGKLTGIDRFYVNFPLHVVVSGIVLSAALLMGNYFATDFDRLPRERVIVEKRITKTRYKTKRVTRRTYTRGAPYKVYYLEISLPGGEHKEVYVPKKLYDKARKGDTATVNIGRGALSFPVFNPHSLELLHPHVNKKKTSRCKYFGTSGRSFPTRKSATGRSSAEDATPLQPHGEADPGQ